MSSIFQLSGTIGKSRRVVLRQGGGGDAGARGNTVDVQVVRAIHPSSTKQSV